MIFLNAEYAEFSRNTLNVESFTHVRAVRRSFESTFLHDVALDFHTREMSKIHEYSEIQIAAAKIILQLRAMGIHQIRNRLQFQNYAVETK